MIWKKPLEGRYVTLRSVLESDAQVTMEMRLNKEKTKFLHSIDNDVEKQRSWIRMQNKTENDYFFLVLDKNGKAIGMMGISEISDNRGHIGRLLMYGNAFESYEAYMLLIRTAFSDMNLKEIYGETDIKNKSAERFTEAFGFIYGDTVYDPELNRYIRPCTLNNENFEKAERRLEKMIYRDK